MAVSWKKVASQFAGGVVPTTTPAASTDVGGMVAYLAAGSVVGYQATAQQTPQRTRYPEENRLSPALALTGATVWPAANDALCIPFELSQTRVAANIHLQIVTSSGNLDVGIYTDAGVKMFSKGATAMAAAGPQTISASATSLAAGRYFLCISVDNGTAALAGFNLTGGSGVAGGLPNNYGFKKQATAYTLPASMTYAAPTSNHVPMAVIEWS